MVKADIKKQAEIPIGTERRINDYQKTKFTHNERNAARIVDIHRSVIDNYIAKGQPLKVLDIGGGSGHEAAEIFRYYESKGCTVACTVLDTTPYESWEQFDFLNFAKGSAFNITDFFEEDSFDFLQ